MQYEALKIRLEMITALAIKHTKAHFYAGVPSVPDLRRWHRRFMHPNNALRKSLLQAEVETDLLLHNGDLCDPCWQTKFESTKLKVGVFF